MKRASHLPVWLDRRGFSAATKARIAATLANPDVRATPQEHADHGGNVVAFPGSVRDREGQSGDQGADALSGEAGERRAG